VASGLKGGITGEDSKSSAMFGEVVAMGLPLFYINTKTPTK
jgi:hypothetical protein